MQKQIRDAAAAIENILYDTKLTGLMPRPPQRLEASCLCGNDLLVYSRALLEINFSLTYLPTPEREMIHKQIDIIRQELTGSESEKDRHHKVGRYLPVFFIHSCFC